MTETKKRTKKRTDKRTKNKTKKTLQDGGKKLGQGTYGCVVSPPAKCTTHHNFRRTSYKVDNRFVSKLIDFRHNESGFAELNIGQKLIKIDPKHHHYSPYFNGCFFTPQRHKDILYFNSDGTDATASPSKSSASSIAQSKSGKKLKKSSKIHSKLAREFKEKCLLNIDHTYLNLIGSHGGITLTNIMSLGQRHDQVIYFKKNYWYLATYLIHNLYLLHRNKIVHRDIKPSNITVDFSYIKDASLAFQKSTQIETCRITLIDFGLAKEIKKTKYNYDEGRELLSQGTQHYIPLEIFAAKILIKLLNRGYESNTTQLLNKMISKSMPKIKRNLEYYHYAGLRNEFFKYTHEKGTKGGSFFLTKKKIEKVFSYVLDLHQHSNLSKSIASLVYGWDIYSLGIVLARIALKFNIDDPEFTTLIFNMIRLEPDKRSTIKSLIRHPQYLTYVKYIKKGHASHNSS